MRSRRQQLIETRRTAFFGRSGEQGRVFKLLEQYEQQFYVNVWGLSGVGKTRLAMRLAEEAEARGVTKVFLDLAGVGSLEALLEALIQSIEQVSETSCTAFSGVTKEYSNLIEEVARGARDDSSGLLRLAKISPDGLDVGKETFSNTPDLQLDYYAKLIGIVGRTKADFFVNPLNRLRDAFLTDIGDLLEELGPEPFLLILDRTERTPAAVLEAFFSTVALDLPGNLILAVFGQKELEGSWKEHRAELGDGFELSRMQDGPATSLIKSKGIEDPKSIKWILSESRGLPISIVVLCEEVTRDPEIASADASGGYQHQEVLERHIDIFQGTDRDLFLRSTVLRSFDQETLFKILPDLPDPANWFEKVTSSPLVTRTVSGYFVHDYVRVQCNRYLERHYPEDWKALNLSCVSLFKERYSQGLRPSDFIEAAYHQVASRDVDAFSDFLDVFNNRALSSRVDECVALFEAAKQTERLPEHWAQLFQASIARLKHEFVDSHAISLELCHSFDAEISPVLAALAHYYCSVSAWYLCKFDQSLDLASMAVSQLEDIIAKDVSHRNLPFYLNRSVGVQALTEDRLGEFSTAIHTVDKMIRMASNSQDSVGKAYALNSKGYFSWHLGDWKTAEGFLVECEDLWKSLRNEFGQCYPRSHLIALKYACGYPDATVDQMEEVVEQCEKSKNIEMVSKSLQNLAWMHLDSGNPTEGRLRAEKAVSVSKDISQKYFEADSSRVLAISYLLEGDSDRCRKLLSEVCEMARSMKSAYSYGRALGALLTLDLFEDRCSYSEYLGELMTNDAIKFPKAKLEALEISVMIKDGHFANYWSDDLSPNAARLFMDSYLALNASVGVRSRIIRPLISTLRSEGGTQLLGAIGEIKEGEGFEEDVKEFWGRAIQIDDQAKLFSEVENLFARA